MPKIYSSNGGRCKPALYAFPILTDHLKMRGRIPPKGLEASLLSKILYPDPPCKRTAATSCAHKKYHSVSHSHTLPTTRNELLLNKPISGAFGAHHVNEYRKGPPQQERYSELPGMFGLAICNCAGSSLTVWLTFLSCTIFLEPSNTGNSNNLTTTFQHN